MVTMHPDDNYNLVIFAAPDGSPTAWSLSYDKVEDGLLRIDPQVRVKRGRRGSNDGTFRYAVTFPFGWVEGNVGVDHDSISIADVKIEVVAHFAAWLRGEIVPAGAGIEFNFLDGIELGVPPGVLPETTDVDVLRRALEDHVRRVIESEG